VQFAQLAKRSLFDTVLCAHQGASHARGGLCQLAKSETGRLRFGSKPTVRNMQNVSRSTIGAESDNILKRLAALRAGLSSAHRRVADQILSNPLESIGQSISELANRCQVSDATVTRFCTTIGLPGYSEFRKALVSALGRSNGEIVISPFTEQVGTSHNLHISTPRSFENTIAAAPTRAELFWPDLGRLPSCANI